MPNFNTVLILLSTILVFFSCGNNNSWINLNDKNGELAIYQRSHTFFKNCSFTTFTLSSPICQLIEAQLPPYCDTLKINLKECKRQYIGIIFNGKKYAYINLFPAKANFPNWKKTAVWVKNGGTSFCGIIYDLEQNKIVEIACNGGA